MKKIWFICLCLAGLTLAWCFHIPDEDWLPSRNKVNSEKVKNDAEFEEAVDSFIDWVNIISTDWDEIKNDEVNNEESDEIIDDVDENIDIEETIENEELLNNEKIIDNESDNQKVENTVE